MVVGKPLVKGMLVQAVNFAQVVKQRIITLQRENERLAGRLDAVKAVNKAKWVLVKYLNMSEEHGRQIHRTSGYGKTDEQRRSCTQDTEDVQKLIQRI